MVFKRIMTGIVALIVTCFSLSVFVLLWKLNGVEAKLPGLTCNERMIKWESEKYIGKVYVEDGAFEQLILYRKATEDCIA